MKKARELEPNPGYAKQLILTCIIGFISGGLGFASSSLLLSDEKSSDVTDSRLVDVTEKLLSEAELTLEALQKEKLEVAEKLEALTKRQKKRTTAEPNNIKVFAGIVESMPPDTAAKTMKEIWNDGKMEFAIQLMRNIEPRNVAKILAEVSDPQLIAELASRYPNEVR